MPLRPLPLIVAVAVLAGAGTLGALALTPAAAQAASPPGGTITVTGTGSASAVPDVVRASIGAETTAPTVDAALSAANDATRQVLAALKDAGVTKKDVRTAGVQLYPRFDDGGQGVTGYTANQSLDVTLRDLGAAGATISAAVAAGGDAARLGGVSFGLSDEGALRTKARKSAFADARATAQEHAELAGGELGAVVAVREEPDAFASVRFQAQSADSAAGSAVPLEPGTTDVSVTAQVRWTLER